MKLYITFGQVHVHRVNCKTFDRDCVAVIECNDEQEGRDLAFKYFDDKWCFSYTDIDKVGMEFYPRGIIEVN